MKATYQTADDVFHAVFAIAMVCVLDDHIAITYLPRTGDTPSACVEHIPIVDLFDFRIETSVGTVVIVPREPLKLDES